MMATRSARPNAALFATGVENNWQALGYGSRGESHGAKYVECHNGGPIDAVISFKPQAMTGTRIATPLT